MTILETRPQTPPPTDTDHGASEPPRAHSGPTQPRPCRRRRVATLVLLALLVPVGWSYGGYLTAAGNAPVGVRTVDWFRDHGFESGVNYAEQWWYTRSKPTGTTPSRSDLPNGLTTFGTSTDRLPSRQRSTLPGEGVWQNVTGLAAPAASVQQTFIRPDAKYPSVVTDLVRLDQRAVKLVYVPGTQELGGASFAWHSQIPSSQRANVLAAFNAGFKFKHITGGAYTEGRQLVRPLKAGSASVVIHRDGTVDVAKWGRDATITSDIVSVRQNLALIVDGAKLVPGMSVDRGGQWGSPKSQFQYTWRTALGIDTQGRLIYAASHTMTLTELAQSMVGAEAVRAMQLDIHPTVSFNWFRPNPKAPLGTDGTKLMASMSRDATRFLLTEERDFFAVTAR